ncbi:MAG: thioredoxin domain-containing protein, partial [Fidelibacterota bacterium]
WDETNGGFFFTSHQSEVLLSRMKEAYDGAIPSGNSISAMNYLKLGRMLSRPEYEVIAERIFQAFSDKINRSSPGFSQMLQAVNFSHGPAFEILIAGRSGNHKTVELLNGIRSRFLPNTVTMLIDPEDDELKSWMPLLRNYSGGDDGEPLVYVCRNFSCKLPTSDIRVVMDQLNAGE